MSDTLTVTATRKTSPWRTPVCRLLVNGREQAGYGVTRFSLQRTRYGRCDTLDLSLVFDRAAVTTPYWFDVADPAAGSALADIDVQLQMRDAETAGTQWTTVFQGIVDHVSFTPSQSSVSVQCRDYLAKLMDMRVQDAWLNHTGEDLVKAVIAAAGLKADVSFPSGMEGQYWQIEHKRQSATAAHRFQTAFDLARYVANGANCDLYASGKTIICKPYPAPSDSGAKIHHLVYSDPGAGSPIIAGATSLAMERDYQTAKGVVIHCISWDSKQRIKSEVYFSALGAGKKNALENGTMHSFRFAGLKQEEIEAKAAALYRQIIAHERVISVEIPGRISLAPRDFMQMTGTGTTWDGVRDVDAVSSTLDTDGGYAQSVTLRSRDTTDNESSDDYD